ncbi:MAG: sulfatase [Deltaproteobacteria bacterium]|nr:sulfatase [Deltaproteobacteria bacterium]MBW2362705.1 sulfatase [Deltaproteobacteria bacterium]
MQGGRTRSLARLALAAACGALVLLGCQGGSSDDSTRLVLLLSVDTLRADRLGAHGGPAGLTPELDALAARSLVFTAAYAPASHTLPSVAALLTGRYPQELGVTGNLSKLPEESVTLARRFREAGWNTAAVVSNWVLRRASGAAAGFDRFDDALPQHEAARPMPERTAQETTAAALAALSQCLPTATERCFLWVHYQDPHGPYTPPPALRAQRLAIERERPDAEHRLPLLPGSFGTGGIPDYQVIDGHDDVAFYRAGYDAEIAYLDDAVGALLRGLEARVPRAAAAVVFTSDHGESLGEQDVWFGHGERLGEAQVHVPLWFTLPGLAPGRRDDVASLLDVRPTLEARFLDASDVPHTGRALLAPGAGEASSTVYLATLQGSRQPRVGVIEGDFKYVATLRDERNWDGRLTRRGDDAIDLTAPAPQIAARLRARLEALIRTHDAAPGVEIELDADDRERMRALGYLDDGAEPRPGR